MRPLALVLGLLLAAPAWASEPVDLKAGQPAPYDCGCADAAWAEQIRVRRATCELERDRLRLALAERPAETEPTTAGLVLVGLVGAAAGLILGVLLAR